MPEQTSGDGADDAEQQTFDESLLDQPRTRGTEGRANCQFPLPARPSRKQKIRDVGTGDQKHGNNGCEQNPEGERTSEIWRSRRERTRKETSLRNCGGTKLSDC